MKATWVGVISCCLVIYYGIVHSASNPAVLLNFHALILVVGGTIAIALLTYSSTRLLEVLDFILFGFLFRIKKEETIAARDLIAHIDVYYRKPQSFEISGKPHPFITESFRLLYDKELDAKKLETILLDRRNAVKRKYLEDAKILNNIAKYPPHLGLLGAASGMIEMMAGLGTSGVDSIGASMAIALSATLWGVGLNNFVFLPLSDNSMKISEDEIYLRDIIIECCVLIKRQATHDDVINCCFNKLALLDRVKLTSDYRDIRQEQKNSTNRHAS